jgi:hypothetical protein
MYGTSIKEHSRANPTTPDSHSDSRVTSEVQQRKMAGAHCVLKQPVCTYAGSGLLLSLFLWGL